MFKFEASSSPNGYTQLPNAILRAKNLSPSSKCLYALLLDYARQDGHCFPGQQRMAEDLGVSKKSIGKWLQELSRFGLITSKRRGLTKTNVYHLVFPEGNILPFCDNHPSPPEGNILPLTKKQKEQDPVKNKQDPSVARLISLGVSLKKSKELLNTFGNGAIHRQIQWLPFRSPTRNAPGLLIRALENNFPAPSAMETPVQRTGSGQPADLKNIFAQLRDTK